MKKGFFKSVVSVTLSLALVMSLPTVAFASAGDSEVTDVEIWGRDAVLGTAVADASINGTNYSTTFSAPGSITFLASKTTGESSDSFTITTEGTSTTKLVYFENEAAIASTAATFAAFNDLPVFDPEADSVTDDGVFIIYSVGDTEAEFHKLVVDVVEDPAAGLTSLTINAKEATLKDPITTLANDAFLGLVGSITLTNLDVAAENIVFLATGVDADNTPEVTYFYYATEAAALAATSDGTEFDPETHTIAHGNAFIIKSTVTVGSDTDTVYYLVTVKVTTATGGDIEGDGTLKEIIYQVVVPTTVDFAINPFQVGNEAGDDSQIEGDNYVITNKTPKVPVKVSFALEAELGTGVTLVSDSSKLKRDDDSATAKDLLFAVKGATTVPVAGETVTLADIKYAADKVDEDVPANTIATLVPFNATSKEVSVSFALKGYGTELAADNVTSFTFYGEMNSHAEWKDNDIGVTGTYSLTALRPDTYTSYDGKPAVGSEGTEGYVPAVPSSYAAGGVGQLKSKPAADLTLTAGAAATSVTLTFNDYKVDGDSYLVALANAPSGAPVVVSGGYTFPDTYYTYDSANGIIDMGDVFAGGAVGTMNYTITIGSNVYNLTAIFQ